jgi:ferric-dicitrate binding protein FerR (iron transport regulator)
MDYSRFTAEDFALDDFFLRWVKSPNDETDAFWHKWLADHPEKRGEAEAARALIQHIAYRTYTPSPEACTKGWETLSVAIDGWESTRLVEPPPAPGPARPLAPPHIGWLRIAASFTALLLAAAGYLWYTYGARTTQRTGYGETRRIVLADRSVVTLNANSSLSYRRHWAASGSREVWLEGEAFFEVVHTENHRKFVVHAAGNLDVEVLGTKFNVYGRKRSTRVLLNDGKVQLNIGQDHRRQVTMQPGELVELDAATGGYVRKVVDPVQHSSWVHRYLLFKDTPVREIVTLLEDTYGVDVVMPEQAMLQSKITGRLPSNNLESLLFALSESLDCEVTRDGERIIFQPRSDCPPGGSRNGH